MRAERVFDLVLFEVRLEVRFIRGRVDLLLVEDFLFAVFFSRSALRFAASALRFAAAASRAFWRSSARFFRAA
ncbi:MAG: hypothetical protein H6849_03395 [Alphaproteobacteria bacterium]|nr:MAG: hypothetical protein H6849_03395 [Alphaproteobacteria bacterium]